jgi:hypothetical protein
MKRTAVHALMVLALAGCGTSAASTTGAAPPTTSTAPSSSSPAGLSQGQGAGICNDFNTWAQQANNQDMPRFNTTLANDEAKAQGTALGNDLVAEDQDLQEVNSLALEPGPPTDPQPIQALEQDCTNYGVTLNP